MFGVMVTEQVHALTDRGMLTVPWSMGSAESQNTILRFPL